MVSQQYMPLLSLVVLGPETPGGPGNPLSPIDPGFAVPGKPGRPGSPEGPRIQKEKSLDQWHVTFKSCIAYEDCHGDHCVCSDAQ